MCGICGIYSPGKISETDIHCMHRMCSVMRHRGPDDEGHYHDDYAALGMRRLSIIDIKGGHQPLSNEDKTLWIVFNGEIYNFQQLRKTLQNKGHTFSSNSDTETIIHAYEEYGDACVHHLVGMFAFALWDSRKHRLFAARDRLGQKPFYYSESNGKFFFGSELKTILCDSKQSRTLDEVALHHYLTLQYIPDPFTIYKNIHKLPPAHVLTYDRNGITLKSYWDLSYEPKLKISEQEAEQELRRLMMNAVQRRMISEVPLGAFLSGGIDSSIIVGLMAQQATKKIKTFSIGFSTDSFNELPFAQSVADKWNTYHSEFIVSPDRLSDILPKIVGAFDEPFADSCAIQTYYLSQMTKEHVTVALNGDAGDEAFAGYPRYWLDTWVAPYSMLPQFITQKLVPMVLSPLREPDNVPIEANWIMGLKRLSQVVRVPKEASIIRWGSFFDEQFKQVVYKDELYQKVKDSPTSDLLKEAFSNAAAQSFVDKTLAVDTRFYLAGNGLTKTDRMTMAHSLEGRSPFCDHELFEFCARLPVEFKLKNRNTKYLLKRTFSDMLGHKLTKRPKRGFAAPIEMWLKDPLKEQVRETLLCSSADIHEMFDVSSLKSLIDEHERGRANHGRRIWALVVLEEWMRQRRANLTERK
ncbi:MAG: asparagine synthase (glutamine-hydrolyzing) [Chitinivibrionales bacterium]|nr:asparagine synthase (glutamine-hydrolyzing) [Chitinivibrionales bacterium]